MCQRAKQRYTSPPPNSTLEDDIKECRARLSACHYWMEYAPTQASRVRAEALAEEERWNLNRLWGRLARHRKSFAF